MKLPQWFRNRSLVVAYIIIVVIGMIGFMEIQNANREIERTAELRVKVACDAVVESKKIIRDIVLTLSPEDQNEIPTDISQELQQIIKESRERNEQLREEALVILDSSDCTIQDPSPGS